MKKNQATLRFAGLIFTYLALILSSAFMPLVRQWENHYPLVTAPEKVDAILVMGGGSIYFDETVGQFRIGGHFPRFLEGARLFKKMQPPFIIASGGDPGGLPIGLKGESPSYAQWLNEMGVPLASIIVEDRSLNSYEEALYIRPILEKMKINKFYLVTSALHMRRSMAVFEKQGLHPIAYPVAYLTDPMERTLSFSYRNIEKLDALIHEYMGMVIYRVMGYR